MLSTPTDMLTNAERDKMDRRQQRVWSGGARWASPFHAWVHRGEADGQMHTAMRKHLILMRRHHDGIVRWFAVMSVAMKNGVITWETVKATRTIGSRRRSETRP